MANVEINTLVIDAHSLHSNRVNAQWLFHVTCVTQLVYAMRYIARYGL